MRKQSEKLTIQAPVRRNGIVVAMLRRGGDGKHQNKQEKRAAQKERKLMAAAY